MNAAGGQDHTTPAICPTFAVSVHSDLFEVREALRRMMQGLAPLDLEVEERASVELVLAEVLNNVVEHAYPEGDKDATIEITCTQRNDGLHVSVRDRGVPMKDGKLPEFKVRELNVDTDDLPECGFGWWMINALTKDVRYSRVEGENCLSFRIVVGR